MPQSVCSPITAAYRNGTFNVKPVIPDTIAKSLAIGNPADGFYDLKIVKESGGAAEAATDQEIVDGIKLLAQTEGIVCAPDAAPWMTWWMVTLKGTI